MIRIKTWIRHDGRIYNAKDELEADGDTENRLVGLGVVEFVDTPGSSGGHEDDDQDDSGDDGQEDDSGSANDAVENSSGDPGTDEGQEEAVPSREELEEEYKALGGQPRSDWTLEKLMSKLEERRGSRE